MLSYNDFFQKMFIPHYRAFYDKNASQGSFLISYSIIKKTIELDYVVDLDI